MGIDDNIKLKIYVFLYQNLNPIVISRPVLSTKIYVFLYQNLNKELNFASDAYTAFMYFYIRI